MEESQFWLSSIFFCLTILIPIDTYFLIFGAITMMLVFLPYRIHLPESIEVRRGVQFPKNGSMFIFR
jgi:hypothetical protein